MLHKTEKTNLAPDVAALFAQLVSGEVTVEEILAEARAACEECGV